jgi:hypothetical protein
MCLYLPFLSLKEFVSSWRNWYILMNLSTLPKWNSLDGSWLPRLLSKRCHYNNLTYQFSFPFWFQHFLFTRHYASYLRKHLIQARIWSKSGILAHNFNVYSFQIPFKIQNLEKYKNCKSGPSYVMIIKKFLLQL